MMRPLPWARMCGKTAFVMRMTPKTLISNTSRAWATELSSAAPAEPIPALLTRTSIRPNRWITCPTAAVDRFVAGHVEVQEAHPFDRRDVFGVAACSDHLEPRLNQGQSGGLTDTGGRTRHEGYRPCCRHHELLTYWICVVSLGNNVRDTSNCITYR